MSDERAGRLALEEAHEAMVVAVEAIRSGEDWQLMLSVAARLHTYSAGNVALLMAQAIERGWDPAELGPLGGYRTLQALGYEVRRGERGLVVLAPVIARARGPVEGEANGDRAVLRGFRLAHVFDVAHQADGPPVPEGPRPVLLEGASPEGLAEGLAAQVGAAGFVLLRAPLSSANGRTDFGARTVTVADRLSPAATTKTLAHELAHVLLHDPKAAPPGQWCREQAEVEAESVAFLVCARAGLSTGAYSWPYLARWSGGDPSLVRASAERAIGCARAILDTSKTPALPGQQVGLGLCRAGEAERVRAPFIDAEDEARRARGRRRRIYAERARQARRSERGWGLER